MTLIFFGHNLTYARFYNALQRNLVERHLFQNKLCMHAYSLPSAEIFAQLQGHSVIPLTRHRKNFHFEKSNAAHPPPLDIDLRFYTRDHIDNQLQQLHSFYYEFFDANLPNTNNCLMIMPGEYRIIEQAAIKVAKKNGIEIIFFEAGPSGTIYFSETGTNANAQINPQRECSLTKLKSQNQDLMAEKKILSRNILKFFDLFFLLSLAQKQSLLDYSEYVSSIKNRLKPRKLFAKYWTLLLQENRFCENQKFILFIGQVTTDVNSTHFGCDPNEVYQQLSLLLKARPDVTLLIRSHPLERCDQLIRRLIKSHRNQITEDDQRPTIADSLSHCLGAITVNSNGGLECLLTGKPVLLLGRSMFGHLYGATQELPRFLELIDSTANEDKIRKQARLFMRKYLLNIDFRNANFENIEDAVDQIIQLTQNNIFKTRANL